jgi:hypothetical protein
VVQQRDKDKAQKLTLPNILHIFFTMYTEKELEIISLECLNAKIQDFSYGKYFEKFKTKCVTFNERHQLLIVDIVNKPETLVLFDQSESFCEEFLHKTTLELITFFSTIGVEQSEIELEVNIVRQYAN